MLRKFLVGDRAWIRLSTARRTLQCQGQGRTILRPLRVDPSRKLPWHFVGATIAIAVGQTCHKHSQCDAVTVEAPGKMAAPAALMKHSLADDFAEYLKSLSKRVRDALHSIWRFLTLLALFTPTLVTLPFATLFQYDDFVDTENCVEFWWWQWLRNSARAAGPCTIKLCQWIATRPDLFPFTLCRHLQELQIDATPPRGAEWFDAENAIAEAVGPEWRKLYDIDAKNTTPLGSGCIAQVLGGKVRATGQSIAVKIIHREVAKTIAVDIDILRYLTGLLEFIPGVKNLSLTDTVNEFSSLMLSQLDLRREARALLKFRENFHCDTLERLQNHSNRVRVTFPKPLPGLAFENVLFESFEDGNVISHYLEAKVLFPVDDIENKEKYTHIHEKGDKRKIKVVGDASTRHALAQAGLDAMLKMIFEDNFIHADLHMGNIIVKNLRTVDQESAAYDTKMQGEGLVVSIIDAGLVAELNTEDRRNFLDLFAAIIRNDGREVGRLMIERNRERDNTMTYAQAERFQDRLQEVVDSVHKSGMALGRMSLGDLLQKVLVGCYQNNVKLDSKFVSVMLSIGIAEGMGRRLDPDIDILKAAAPFILKASAKFAAMYAAKKMHKAQVEHAQRHPLARFESNVSAIADESMDRNY